MYANLGFLLAVSSFLVSGPVVPVLVPSVAGAGAVHHALAPAHALQTAQVKATVKKSIVPNLRGKTIEEAKIALTASHLTIGKITYVPSEPDSPSQGTVASQDPNYLVEVAIGTAVNVRVVQPAPEMQLKAIAPLQVMQKAQTAGAKQVKPNVTTVPNLRGKTVEEAKTALDASHLTIGTITYVPADPDSPSPGTIAFQDPNDLAQVAIGTAVNVRVVQATPATQLIGPPVQVPLKAGTKPAAKQPKTKQEPKLAAAVPPRTRMPNLVGRRLDDQVRTLLTARRVRLGSVTNRSSNEVPGTIVEQNPPPNADVASWSNVDVVVAVSPPPAMIVVPNLRGRTVQEAREILAQRKLRLGAVITPPHTVLAPGSVERVVDQRPLADSSVEIDSEVGVVVAAQPPAASAPTTVPDLFGRHETELTGILGSRGLRLGQVERKADQRPQGTVIEQAPGRGAVVKRGDRVKVTVVDPQVDQQAATTSQVSLVGVPNVVGMLLPDARQVLDSIGLRLEMAQQVEGNRESRRIAEQSPRPRSLVPPGSIVNVHLAPVPPREIPSWLWWALSATAGAAVVLFARGVREGLADQHVTVDQVRAKASPGSFTSEIEHCGDLVDGETLFRASVDRQPSTAVDADARIIAESKPGEP